MKARPNRQRRLTEPEPGQPPYLFLDKAKSQSWKGGCEMPALGKRYLCDKCATEVLCNKAGTGTLECCGEPMKIKEAKPLPSSD